MASTSEASRLVELIQLSAEAGPCVESFRTGEVVSVPDIAASPEQWARFRDSAHRPGIRARCTRFRCGSATTRSAR